MTSLTALAVKKQSIPGRYGDGGGLWLQVRGAEHKSWLFRFKLHGRERQMGLGPLPDVSLAQARELALECRTLVRQGIDPIEHRKAKMAELAAQQGAHTFQEVAEQCLAAHEEGWRNLKHRAQWRSTLERYAYPDLGDRPVAAIETDDVLRALQPIWKEKNETASRLRGRIEAVLSFAAARNWRRGENPARWRGHLDKLLQSRSKTAKVEHHAALHYEQVAAFMGSLRTEEGSAARALEFVILTAARTGEVLGARWSEIDRNGPVWTVPAERMKAGREHRVPLSGAATAVLQVMEPLRKADEKDGYVFPGRKDKAPLSNMALAMMLRRMGHDDITVHGFRSTFRDWCAEVTDVPRDVAEAALAHTLTDKVEAAYRRGDMLDKRAALMELWATYCATVDVSDDAGAPGPGTNLNSGTHLAARGRRP